jgi:hypothetical protein
VNLHQIIEHGSDLEHQEIPVKDRNEIEIGMLVISVSAFDALNEVMAVR